MAEPRQGLRRRTIRFWMGLVLVIAMVLGLTIPAIDVLSVRDYHGHTYLDVTGPAPVLCAVPMPAPFWPRYYNRLLGRPWRTKPECTHDAVAGHLEERCEYVFPDVCDRSGGGMQFSFTNGQIALAQLYKDVISGTSQSSAKR